MRIKILAVLSAVAMLSFAGCGGEKRVEKAADNQTAVSAQVEVVSQTTMKEIYEAVGTVRSKTTSTLSSKVIGQVVAVHVKEGDKVKAGQLLIEIDDRDMAAQLRKARAGLNEAQNAQEEVEQTIKATESAKAAAEANLNFATSTYRRYQALLKRQSISRQEFDEIETKQKAAVAEVNRANAMLQSIQAKKGQVEAKIEQAKADIDSAQAYHSYTKINSPIDGLVTMKSVDLGNLAAPGTMLLTVEDTEQYRLEAVVEESKVGLIHLGDEVAVGIDALGDKSLTGKVSEIVPSADPISHSFIIKLDLPRYSSVRSGMFGRAKIQIGQKQTITLPASAISERGQLTGVYVVDEAGKARLRLVKTGKHYGDRVEILSGLNAGERVVVGSTELVSDGSKIGQ